MIPRNRQGIDRLVVVGFTTTFNGLSLERSWRRSPPLRPAAMAPGSMAASVDAAYEANLLTGQASHPSVEELTRRALEIKKDKARLFVFWSSPSAAECQAIGPATRCFCTHSYSSHAWYETGSKRVACRVEGCKCECFSYVPGRGASHLRCGCKHAHHEHRTSDGRPAPCQHAGCGCTGFHSTWRCAPRPLSPTRSPLTSRARTLADLSLSSLYVSPLTRTLTHTRVCADAARVTRPMTRTRPPLRRRPSVPPQVSPPRVTWAAGRRRSRIWMPSAAESRV